MDAFGDGHAVLRGGGEAVLLHGVDGFLVEAHADGFFDVHVDGVALGVDGESDDALTGEFCRSRLLGLLRIDAVYNVWRDVAGVLVIVLGGRGVGSFGRNGGEFCAVGKRFGDA